VKLNPILSLASVLFVVCCAAGAQEWQFARHYGVTMGYGGMHFSNSTSSGEGTLHLRPTLHGPILVWSVLLASQSAPAIRLK
jgi:hypothetical protein